MTSSDEKQSHGNLCWDLDLDLWASQVCLPRTSSRSHWRMFQGAGCSPQHPQIFSSSAIGSHLRGQQGISGESACPGVAGTRSGHENIGFFEGSHAMVTEQDHVHMFICGDRLRFFL